MWANARRDGRPAEYRLRPLFNAAKFGWRPLLECCAVMLPKQESARLGTKWMLHLTKFCYGARTLENVYIVYEPRRQPNIVQSLVGFPLSDLAAVTKPRCETCWNLLGCPKLKNWSQPLVCRSSQYCEDMWRRYCRLTSFFFRLSIHA